MAKKTVLKRVLKYAPLKSEFVRQVAQDETIKDRDQRHMYEVPAVALEAQDADYYEVPPQADPATGEVLEQGQQNIGA